MNLCVRRNCNKNIINSPLLVMKEVHYDINSHLKVVVSAVTAVTVEVEAESHHLLSSAIHDLETHDRKFDVTTNNPSSVARPGAERRGADRNGKLHCNGEILA